MARAGYLVGIALAGGRAGRQRYGETAAGFDAARDDHGHLLARVRGADAQVTSWSSSMRTDNLREGMHGFQSISARPPVVLSGRPRDLW